MAISVDAMSNLEYMLDEFFRTLLSIIFWPITVGISFYLMAKMGGTIWTGPWAPIENEK